MLTSVVRGSISLSQRDADWGSTRTSCRTMGQVILSSFHFLTQPAARNVCKTDEEDQSDADHPVAHGRRILERSIELVAEHGPCQYAGQHGKECPEHELPERDAKRSGDDVLNHEGRHRGHIRSEHGDDAMLLDGLGRFIEIVTGDTAHHAM